MNQNKIKKYPVLTRILHWLTALMVIGLFVSGWYMVDLDYYSQWYQTLPELHMAVGVVLLVVWIWVLIRYFLNRFSSKPFSFDDSTHHHFERFAAKSVKILFYLLVSLMVITGYLIATGGGDAVVLFATFKLPAISHFSASQIDTMGSVHKFSSYLLMVLVFFHVAGAIKHHFIDKDTTLKRML